MIGRCASCGHRRGEHDYPRPGTECSRCLCPRWFAPLWWLAWRAFNDQIARIVWRLDAQDTDRARAGAAAAGPRGSAALPQPPSAPPVDGSGGPGRGDGGADRRPDPVTAPPSRPVAAASGDPARASASAADRATPAVQVKWLARLLLPVDILSDLERTVAQVSWSQAEILVRLRRIQEQLDRIVEQPPRE